MLDRNLGIENGLLRLVNGYQFSVLVDVEGISVQPSHGLALGRLHGKVDGDVGWFLDAGIDPLQFEARRAAAGCAQCRDQEYKECLAHAGKVPQTRRDYKGPAANKVPRLWCETPENSAAGAKRTRLPRKRLEPGWQTWLPPSLLRKHQKTAPQARNVRACPASVWSLGGKLGCHPAS